MSVLTRLNPSALLRIAALSAGLASAPATADTYLAIEGSSFGLDNRIDADLNPVGVRIKAGTPLADFLDVEGQVAWATDGDSIAFDRLSVGMFGGYLKAYLPLGYNSAFFALGGYSWMELAQEVNGVEYTDERSGFSWGLGMETRLNDRIDLTADFMNYLQRDGLFENISAWSLGLKFYY